MKLKNGSIKFGRISKKYKLKGPLAFVLLAIYFIVLSRLTTPTPVSLPGDAAPISLYSNQAGDDLHKTFKEAILQARESIVCMIYSLTDEEILEALRKKSEEGVSVTVVHDPVATQEAAFKLGPKVTTLPRRSKGLMHNKLLSIDRKQAWIGSANFTRDSLRLHANLVLGMQSPLIAEAIEKKALDRKRRLIPLPLTLQTGEQQMEIWFLPDAPQALDRLIGVLNSAKKTVKVAMFTFTHPRLIQALCDAHHRGVSVQVVLDSDSSRQTSKKAFQRFKREAVPVRVSDRSGLLHEKIAIVDDAILVSGSANWTKAAFTANDEVMCLLFDLTEQQQQYLERFWQTTLHESR